MKLIVNGQEVQPTKKVKLHQYMHEREIIALMRKLQEDSLNEQSGDSQTPNTEG